MTVQMTVRMADDAAHFVDRTVATGAFTSRADYLSWLVQKDAMRQRALADIEKLRGQTGDGDPYPELSGMVDHVSADPLHLEE